MGPEFMHVFIFIFFPIHLTCALKVLGIFPIPSKSHFNFNNAVMKSLINSGHEVSVITWFPGDASAENYSLIMDVSSDTHEPVGQAPFDIMSKLNIFQLLNLMADMELVYCSKVLHLPEIRKILNGGEKIYDVVFVEIFLLYNCFLPIAEKMSVPVIGTVPSRTALPADISINNPNNPAIIPYELVTKTWKLINIFGRMINVWNYVVVSWYENFVFPKILMRFHYDNIGQLNSLEKYLYMEPALILYNNHASLFSRAMNPNAIEIGGIHLEDAKPLPQHIQKFIDEADHGVILFTLGSVVRVASLPSKTKEAFREAFAEVPQRVIWKFEEEIKNVSSNVMILNWVPQRDILEQKKVIGFISHCGLGGMNEAIHTGTPMVATPLFCDQHDNADLLEKLEVAVVLGDIENITKETVLNALNSILNDTRFKNNMQKLSVQFKDRPMTPQQTVVYWTEYVVRHQGAPHLKSPASQLHWYQFLMLDVIFVLAAVLLIFMCLLKHIFGFLSLCVCNVIKFFNRFRKAKPKKN